jgi:hypothetical protein
MTVDENRLRELENFVYCLLNKQPVQYDEVLKFQKIINQNKLSEWLRIKLNDSE